MPKVDFFRQFGFFFQRDFLDPAFRATLAQEMRAVERTPSLVNANGKNIRDEGKRNSQWAVVSSETRALVQGRLAELKPALEAHFQKQLSNFDSLRFLVYDHGTYFAPHRDAQITGPLDGRQLAIVMFINGEVDN